LDLYGVDLSVNALQDPSNRENVIIDKEKIDTLIGQHFARHFEDKNRQLTDPTLTTTEFEVQMSEVKEIVERVDKEKATGWTAIPRQIGDREDTELLQAIAQILQDILNSGNFPEVFTCTKLTVIRKDRMKTASLETIRPLQLQDVMKLYFENLAQPELYLLANDDNVTGDVQFGFKKNKGVVYSNRVLSLLLYIIKKLILYNNRNLFLLVYIIIFLIIYVNRNRLYIFTGTIRIS
jgi:hypothetical protein